ncbi:MAG: AAA family ATPase [Planctomycetales bacterium]|nr:AAA family ATPase [Planctomycetales bacterium]
MYIESIELENIRTFETKTKLQLVHPDRVYQSEGIAGSDAMPEPTLNNVNLLFGDNASGKTTLLESIALASLGPTATDSRISPRPLIRFKRETQSKESKKTVSLRKWDASICVELVLHGDEFLDIDRENNKSIGISELRIRKRGELESFFFHEERERDGNVNWDRAYESDNESFFIVAYGATRRVDPKAASGQSMSKSSKFGRANRVESVMMEGYPMIPLQSWFLDQRRGKRHDEIIGLVNQLLGQESFVFDGVESDDDFLFSKGGMDIPSKSLSDGYRAFLGWTTDLLYHLDFASQRSNKKLNEIPGVVLVDEIDLHLHPKWQMNVIKTVAETFPRLQFIFTSHSPLIAGTVEWMNIIHLKLGQLHRTIADQFQESIHGLDADQILVSSLFGLESTRAEPKRDQLRDLTIRARRGDDNAAKQLIQEMARGLEAKK